MDKLWGTAQRCLDGSRCSLVQSCATSSTSVSTVLLVLVIFTGASWLSALLTQNVVLQHSISVHARLVLNADDLYMQELEMILGMNMAEVVMTRNT